MSFLWIIGVSIAVFDTFLGTIGKQWMKLSHTLYSKGLVHRSRMVLLAAGLFVMVLNPLLSLVSYYFASPSILAPFSGCTILWNMALCPFVVGEHITLHEFFGSLFIVAGIAIICGSADHTEVKYDMELLLELCKRRKFDIFISIFAVFILILLAIIYLPKRYRTKNERIKYLCFGIASGSIGGCQFVIKMFVCIMKECMSDIKILTHFYTYAVLAATIAVSIGQIYILHRGLRYFTAKQLLPLYQGTFIVVGSVSGVLFFEEFKRMKTFQWILYPIGLVFIIGGLVYLTILSKHDSLIFTGEVKDKNKNVLINRHLSLDSQLPVVNESIIVA